MRRTHLTNILAYTAAVVSADFVPETTNARNVTLGTSYGYGTAYSIYDGQRYFVTPEMENIIMAGPGTDPAANKAPDRQNFDDDLELKDSYFNGTAMLKTARSGNPLIACEGSYIEHTDAWLAIGDMTPLSTDAASARTGWDKNPFFFQFNSGNNTEALNTGDAARSWGFDFKSSTSTFLWGQAWTLNSTKAGDGFDIAGRYTTTKLENLNSFRYSSTTCMEGDIDAINLNWDIELSGHVSPSAANIKIVTRLGSNDTVDMTAVEFKGTSWAEGPKLVVTGEQIKTEGLLKKTGSAAAMRPVSTSAIAVLFVSVLLWLG